MHRLSELCPFLTQVTIGNSVESIGNSAFRDCQSLTEIVIPNSVTTIDSYAFQDSESLTRVTIGDSVETIGISAFYGCTSLTEVRLTENTATRLNITEEGTQTFFGKDNVNVIFIASEPDYIVRDKDGQPLTWENDTSAAKDWVQFTPTPTLVDEPGFTVSFQYRINRWDDWGNWKNIFVLH